VGREDEGVSLNRPELVTLTEFWIVMRTISAFYTSQIEKQPSKPFTKLQKRVQPGVATLLVKVKAHRGDPLNEEADIRAKMGHQKEQKE
jgi:ribonuclease HI